MERVREYLAETLHLVVSEQVWEWMSVLSATVFLGLIFGFISQVAKRRLSKRRERSLFSTGHIVEILLSHLGFVMVWIWSFFIAAHFLGTQFVVFNKSVKAVLTISTSWQVAIWGLALFKIGRTRFVDERTRDFPSNAAALSLMYTVLKFLFLIVVFLWALSNLGVNISALVAGLGVGGIAIALAAQNVLGDLLASLSIILDKPFLVGDYIVTGQDKGTVEHIGLKTTRLRSLTGEELILSNKDILESRIRNYRKIKERRFELVLGVTYQTPTEKLALIPVWISALFAGQPDMRMERCRLNQFSGSSLDFELIYFVGIPDYNECMKHRERIMLAILKKFESEGVNFAYPTQSLYIEKQ